LQQQFQLQLLLPMPSTCAIAIVITAITIKHMQLQSLAPRSCGYKHSHYHCSLRRSHHSLPLHHSHHHRVMPRSWRMVVDTQGGKLGRICKSWRQRFSHQWGVKPIGSCQDMMGVASLSLSSSRGRWCMGRGGMAVEPLHGGAAAEPLHSGGASLKDHSSGTLSRWRMIGGGEVKVVCRWVVGPRTLAGTEP
jgi:hypothetical protein